MSGPTVVARPWLPSLQSLRGLAALWVVLYHVDVTLWGHGLALLPLPGTRIGWLGVDLFFVLSAYLLGQPFLEGRARPYPTFLADRFLRIAPAYYASALVAMLVILWVVPQNWSPWWASASLFFVNNLHVGTYFALNPAFWSLAVEMQFYLILPLLARLFTGRRWPWGLALCVLVSLAVRAVTFDWALVGAPWISPFNALFVGTFGLPSFLAHFGLGLAAARLRTVPHPTLAAIIGLPLVLVPALLWIPATSVAFGFESLAGQLLVRPIAAAGFTLWILAAASAGWLRTALAWGPLLRLGDMSYSLYLIHIPVQIVVDHAVDGLNNPGLFALLAVPASLVCGAVLYYAVERPAQQWRHRRKRRLSVTGSPALPPPAG